MTSTGDAALLARAEVRGLVGLGRGEGRGAEGKGVGVVEEAGDRVAVGKDLEKFKQRLSLLDYLRQQNWVARPSGHGHEFVGLCPLHQETRPSFYVNARA